MPIITTLTKTAGSPLTLASDVSPPAAQFVTNGDHVQLLAAPAVGSARIKKVNWWHRLDNGTREPLIPGDYWTLADPHAVTWNVPNPAVVAAAGVFKIELEYTLSDGSQGVAKYNVQIKPYVAPVATCTINVTLFNDPNANGMRDVGESPTAARYATISDAAGTQAVPQQLTDANGRTSFVVPAGTYRVSRIVPKGYVVSNNTDGYVVVTVSPGQTVEVSIGTKTVAAAQTDSSPIPPAVTPDKTDPGTKLIHRLKIGIHDLVDRVYDQTIARLFGLDTGAVWVTPNFDSYSRDNEAERAMTYERAGISMLWRVAGTKISPADAKIKGPVWCLKFVADMIAMYDADPVTRGRVIRFEWLNEPEQKDYFLGTPEEYADSLDAVYAAVKAKYGDRVLIYSAGWSYSISTFEGLAARLAKSCDRFGFHGYPHSTSTDALNIYTRFNAQCVKYGKPGCITEGAPGAGTAAERAVMWPVYLQTLDSLAGIEEVIIFAARPKGYTNGAGAPFDMSWNLTDCGRAIAGAVA